MLTSKLRFSLLALISCALAAAQTPITIKVGTLIDGKGRVLKNQMLTVVGSTITQVGDAKGKVTYDLSDLTMTPGWIDTHVHLAWFFNAEDRLDQGGRNSKTTPQQAAMYTAANAYKTLVNGFTTVQSLGSPIDADLRDQINRGLLPGPRLITSLRSVNENTGDPAKIREVERQMKADGADVIKLFATKSIRDGGAQSMSNEQIDAACGEAKAMGLRGVVHAHAPDGATRAIQAGCTAIEHGTFMDDATLQLMHDKGTFFDPNFLVLHNYLDNKPKFLGIGNYSAEGFAYMEKALPKVAEVLKMARKHNVKVVLGTDAVAGAHGRNAEEFIYRVKDGGDKPMDAIISGTSMAAASLDWATRSGRSPSAWKRTWWR